MNLYLRLQNIRSENPPELIDYIFLYIVGGTIGTLYENLYYYFWIGRIENHSGSVFSPVNIVYGFGICLMVMFLYRIRKWYQIVIIGSLIAGVMEFSASYLSEVYLGVSTWNYRGVPLNIAGRTTVPYMLAFGLMFLVLIVAVIPFFFHFLHRISRNTRLLVGALFAAVIVLDWSLSFLAVLRYAQRNRGIYYDIDLIRRFDEIFNDHFMKERYPNLYFT